MSDLEKPVRKKVVTLLEESCEIREPAPIRFYNGDRGEVDVLCRPRIQSLHQFTFAIEVKALESVADKQLGPWIKQAADYVGAIPVCGWPQIVATFIWLVDIPYIDRADEHLRMDGMLQLAQHFRVGKAHNSHGCFALTFGPSADVYRARTVGWTSRAPELLGARRKQGGSKKRLQTPSFTT